MKIKRRILMKFYNAYDAWLLAYYTQSLTFRPSEEIDKVYVTELYAIAAEHNLSFDDMCIYEQLARQLWDKRNGAV